jgi:HKD family nuclease
MKTTFISDEAISATLKRLIDSFDDVHIAVAWGSTNPTFPLLLKNQSKIRHFLVGTHFYQTEPALLEQIKHLDVARVMYADSSGTFHPKLYLFFSKDKAAAIVGSANFTNGAMSRNVEACILLEGDAQEASIAAMLKFIKFQWKSAYSIDEDFLRDYRIQHDAKKSAKDALNQFKRFKRPKHDARKGDPLEMDWKTFLSHVKTDKHHSVDGRLAVLRGARNLINKVNAFSQLTEIERKAFAGTLGPKEWQNNTIPWAWFGSMFGAGVFKNRIKDNHLAISGALDAIPHTGLVSRNDYDAFVEKFQSAFTGQGRGAGIAPASRLLAMKRPDYFVCYDGPNRAGLSAHFGIAQSAVRLDSYWDYIIEPMMCSQWWLTPRPNGKNGEIWDGRAAFLDALYYET